MTKHCYPPIAGGNGIEPLAFTIVVVMLFLLSYPPFFVELRGFPREGVPMGEPPSSQMNPFKLLSL